MPCVRTSLSLVLVIVICHNTHIVHTAMVVELVEMLTGTLPKRMETCKLQSTNRGRGNTTSNVHVVA